MPRTLAPLAVSTLLAVAATAQCFETAFGNAIGLGDDTLLALQPMNIVFPMGGVASTYSHVQISTNGVLFLSNGGPPVGATATGYGSVLAPRLAALQGAAGECPRLAPFWHDLNLTAVAGSGVFVNNSIAGKCVITWRNAFTYNLPATVMTFQVQLLASGAIHFFYDARCQVVTASYGPLNLAVTGVSEGNAVARNPNVDLSLGGASVASRFLCESFLSTSFDLQNRTVSFLPNPNGGYDQTVALCVPAAHSSYGSGCYTRARGSVYEQMPAAAFDLANRSFRFLPGGAGYTLAASGRAFVPPSATATTLPTDDDGQVLAQLGAPFPYPGGATTSLSVCGNGIVSVGNQPAMSPNFWTPNGQGLLSANETAWYAWHDFNQTIPGSGAIRFEQVAGIAYITWDGVWDQGGTSVADASTLQWQFDTTTGEVHLVFRTVSLLGASGSDWAVGYSPGGPSLDPGSLDLSMALPVTLSGDVTALALQVAPAPVLGTTLTYTTSHIGPTAILAVQMLSLGQIEPGIDLASLGAPGCFQLLDTTSAAIVWLSGSPTTTYALPIPNALGLLGLPVYSQSAAMDLAANALGLVTSNGLRSLVNSF